MIASTLKGCEKQLLRPMNLSPLRGAKT